MTRPFVRIAVMQLLLGAATAVAATASPKVSAPSPLPQEGWPGGTRAALVPPAEVWDSALRALGLDPGKPLGYPRETMARYGRDDHRLRTVDELFANVLAIPRASGRVAEELLADRDNLAEIVRRGFVLTDIAAGRMLPLPERPGWGFPAISEDATPAQALDALIAWAPADLAAGAISAADREAFLALPVAIQRFVLRLVVAAAEARPWLRAAFDEVSLRAATGTVTGGEPDRAALMALAAAPWSDERLGQLASERRAAFELIGRTDRAYLAFGSAIALALADEARNELSAAGASAREPWPHRCVRFQTALGDVEISGTSADVHDNPALVAVDLGGNDLWLGAHAAPLSLASPVAYAVDLGGDDRWDAADSPAALGAGLFGVGLLVDLAGDDVYHAHRSALGCAWYGSGVLLDLAGDDFYDGDRWTQGAAHVGVAALVDLEGHDRYRCASESQAMGSTLGAGLLIDAAGDDHYLARDDGNISELYLGQSVAMAQGVGYGRRADLGDGHSLAGGFGVLVDGGGDDRYDAQVWSQGAGYWWGVGMLEDLAGNDRYRNGKYSLGAAAHFAIGVQVDLTGDDAYNIGNVTAVNQFQGHARDGSIGISMDGDGDDDYELRTHCGGSADLGSIALLWDRRGNDCYGGWPSTPSWSVVWQITPPLGSTTRYPPARSFRDDLDALGVFLDTGGSDDYRLPPGPAGDDALWRRIHDPHARAVGRDAGWYEPAARGTTGR